MTGITERRKSFVRDAVMRALFTPVQQGGRMRTQMQDLTDYNQNNPSVSVREVREIIRQADTIFAMIERETS